MGAKKNNGNKTIESVRSRIFKNIAVTLDVTYFKFIQLLRFT